MKVLYVDNHILVVDKPAGLSTQKHGGESLEEMAKEWIKKKYRKEGKVFLEPIHRLDTPVSGIVLFARTSKALSRLQEEMREKKIRRIYYARVEGKLPSEEGVLEHFLIHDDFRARVVKHKNDEAKKAVLRFRLLHKDLVEIELETGRYHQIRAQFSAIGCPILGDRKYGSTKEWREGIALHHGRIEFIHPVTKKCLSFESAHFF